MKEYSAESIKILDGLEGVRKVPSMYIGSTGVEGLHQLIYELVDNSVDEALEGYCDKIVIVIHKNNSITCEDNGRGIPVEIHAQEGAPALEVVLTKLHAGGKFDKETYKYSAGLHGVGLSVVNALSEYLEVEVRRNGKVYFQRYERGSKVTELQVIGDTDRTGTKITFRPDRDIFETTEFSYDLIAQRMREISFLNNGVHIILVDERKGRRQEFRHEGGIKAFVKFLNSNKNVLFDEPIYVATSKPPLDHLEVAIQYNDGYNENIQSFVNNVNTKEGGTHVTGFRSALTRSVNNFIQKNIDKKQKETVTGDDIKEGLVAVINIKLQNPQFEGQTKAKLGNSEIKGLVESVLNESLSEYFELNPDVAKAIVNKALEAKRAREAAKKAKELIKSKNLIESGLLPGKLADCQESDPEICELFIVEGDSAGGSAKQARNRRTQAILPLKGKILNVEKSRNEKILSNDEIRSIFLALGVNSEKTERLRYGKVIIMTDADVDGSHIRTLLLTLFYRKMPEVIERGCLYIAQPPLFRIKHGNKEIYAKDEKELDELLTKRAIDKIECTVAEKVYTGDLLLDSVRFIKKVERFLRDAEGIGVKRELGIYLLEHGSSERKAFEEEGRLSDLVKWASGLGYLVELKRDKEHGLFFISLRDVTSSAREISLGYDFFSQEDFVEAKAAYERVKNFYKEKVDIVESGKKRDLKIEEFVKFIEDKGKEGLTIQRYKGLGEMNPEQLWETTMNPEKRSLIKVSIEDAIEADQVFTILMGNNVDRRRIFIEENALNVKNLDI
ncbi:MAG: DNA topoisomerase (ATP-hydrolyzing) subunit B [Deltaproteobacteria bacterium]|nr:DNA topoisomerase (ATP-hydrolyzing) subunit B [Deltaproteobacteria bacterium]